MIDLRKRQVESDDSNIRDFLTEERDIERALNGLVYEAYHLSNDDIAHIEAALATVEV